MSDKRCGILRAHGPHSWGGLNWCPGSLVPSEVAETTAGEREGTCPSLCVERSHPGREHDETTDGCYCWELCAMGPTCPGANAGLEWGCWRATTPAEPDAEEAEGWEYAIEGDWLVQVVNKHTCGTGPDGYYGAHEPGCGSIPIANIAALLDRVRREEGAKVLREAAEAIDSGEVEHEDLRLAGVDAIAYHGWSEGSCVDALNSGSVWHDWLLARAASVGRGEGL